MINRCILWLSLAGMILSLHLWVQKSRGFDQGCLGLETHSVPAAEGGCTAGALQAGSHLFGVSNAAWGYAFYFSLALLSFGKIVGSPTWTRRVHGLGEIGVTAAFAYSAYLLYFQTFVAGAFCVLCLTSIGFVTVLFALHVALRLRGGCQAMAGSERSFELGLAGGALFAAMGVLVGVLVFVNRLGTRPLDQGGGEVEMRRIVGRMLPAYIAPGKIDEMRACHFDGMVPPIDLTRLIGPATPFLGNPEGMPVVVFADPHCGHCKIFHPTFVKLVERYRDRVRFYLQPRLVWDFSISGIAALKLTEPSGKYFDLWNLALREPERARLTLERLTEFFHELGLDATDLAQRIDAVRSQVLAERKRVADAGIDEAPTIFVGGRQVFAWNYSEECLAALIEDSLPPGRTAPGTARQNGP